MRLGFGKAESTMKVRLKALKEPKHGSGGLLPRYTIAVLVLSLFCCQADGSAQLYKPTEPLTVKAWVVGDDGSFIYPELGDSAYSMPAVVKKRELGLAFSGGSSRAAALALGWMRALHLLKVTHQAGYLATNSGSSWFNIAFSFQKKDTTDKFLGPYIPPGQLTVPTLDRTDEGTSGSFATVLAKAGVVASGLRGAWQDLRDSGKAGAADADVGGWTESVGEAFLEPYDLNEDRSTFTAAGTSGAIHEAAGKLPITVYQYHDDGGARPFPLIMGVAYVKDIHQPYLPFELTPLYAGIAAAYRNVTPMIGGGFVDPLGLNSFPPAQKPKERQGAGGSREPVQVQVTSAGVVPLKMMAGISSAIFASRALPELPMSLDATGAETLQYWNQIDFSGGRVVFVDGEVMDNTAVTMLLRRRVSRIIAGYATKDPLANATTEDWVKAQPSVAALFGAMPVNGKGGWEENHRLNQMMQVFPRADYTKIVDGMKAIAASGGPVHHLATHKVQANPFQAIAGGWEVEVLWVINHQMTDWEQELPEDTQQMLTASRQTSGWRDTLLAQVNDLLDQGAAREDLKTYPYITSGDANLSPALTGLLSQQATWQMLQLEQKLRQLMPNTTTATQKTNSSSSSNLAVTPRVMLVVVMSLIFILIK